MRRLLGKSVADIIVLGLDLVAKRRHRLKDLFRNLPGLGFRRSDDADFATAGAIGDLTSWCPQCGQTINPFLACSSKALEFLNQASTSWPSEQRS